MLQVREEVLHDVEDTSINLGNTDAFAMTWETSLSGSQWFHHLNVNGPSKKQTSFNLRANRLMIYSTYKNLKLFQKCVAFVVLSITTDKCGLKVLILLLCYPESAEEKHFVGQIK